MLLSAGSRPVATSARKTFARLQTRTQLPYKPRTVSLDLFGAARSKMSGCGAMGKYLASGPHTSRFTLHASWSKSIEADENLLSSNQLTVMNAKLRIRMEPQPASSTYRSRQVCTLSQRVIADALVSIVRKESSQLFFLHNAVVTCSRSYLRLR